MTDRVSYFVVQTTGKSKKVAHACNMLRHVDRVVQMDGEKVFVVLEQPLRDEEEEFGSIERAVRSMAGVRDVVKGMRSGACGSLIGFGMTGKIMDFIDGMEPAPPPDKDGYERYASDLRSWGRVRMAVQDALLSSTKS